MKIGIINAYDARNIGDLAIVITQAAWLRRRFPGAEIRVFSHHAEQNVDYFGIESVEAILHMPPEGSAAARLLKPLSDFLIYKFGPKKRYRKFAEFDSCDMYALCGGGYLYSSLSPFVSRNLFVLCLTSLLAIRTGKPVIQFPQSYGPLTKQFDRWMVRKLAKKLSVLVGRSAASMRFLGGEGLAGKTVLIPDVVLGLRSLCPAYFSPRFPRAGLGIAPVDFRFALRTTPGMVEEYIAKLVEVGERFYRRTGEGVTLFLQVSVKGRDDDSLLALRIHEALTDKGVPARIVSPPRHLRHYTVEFQKMRVFIGCRMHSCIFAILAETPTIALSYQPKFRGLFEQLNMLDWVREIDAWDVDWALERIDAVLRDEVAMRAAMRVAGEGIGREIEQKLDAAFTPELQKLEGVRGAPPPSLPKAPERKGLSFSIITPSYRQLPYLKACAASVADQNVELEHIIQDAESGPELQAWVRAHTQAKLFVESDNGMYDAINRGFRRARGDIVAWLNCDEQYLPGALAKVAAFFEAHPGVEVLFGDALLITKDAEILSYRRAILPSLLHIQLAHLNTLSCATFVRASVLVERRLYLKPAWKAIADAVWIADMLRSGVKLAVLNEPLSAFTFTEVNLGQSSLAKTEMKRWRDTLPAWKQKLRVPVILIHRAKKMARGAYSMRHLETWLYSLGNPAQRKPVIADRLSFMWAATSQRGWRSVFQSISASVSAAAGNAAAPRHLPPRQDAGKNETPTRFGTAVLFAGFMLAVAAILLIDSLVAHVTITPILLALLLIGLALIFRPAYVVTYALLTTFADVFALRYMQPFDAGSQHEWLTLLTRIVSYTLGCLMAVLISLYRCRSKTSLQQTFEIVTKVPIPIIVSDAAGYITMANDAAARFMDRAPEELLGQRYVHFFGTDADEGKAMRAYIEFFENPAKTASTVRLIIRTEPAATLDARVICVGDSDDRSMITLLESAMPPPAAAPPQGAAAPVA